MINDEIDTNNNANVNGHNVLVQKTHPKSLLKTSKHFAQRKGTGRRLSFSDENGFSLTEVRVLLNSLCDGEFQFVHNS